MVAEISYRRAGEADIPVLADHHRRMFEEMRATTGLSLQSTCCGPQCGTTKPVAQITRPADFEGLERAQREKLALQMPDGICIAWIADNNAKPVGSGGLSILQTVPVPEDPSASIGFIHSIFVRPSMRRQGIACSLVDRLLEDAREQGLHRVQLAASEAGKSLYERKGFQPLQQMILWL